MDDQSDNQRGESVPGAYWLKEGTLAAILDNVSDGVLTYDHGLQITSFNQAAELITGYSRDEAVGRRCQEIFRCQECERGCALNISSCGLTPEKNYHLRLVRKDGSSRMVTVNTIPLWDEGRSPGVVVTFRDITPLVTLRSDVEERHSFHNIVARSPRMRTLFCRIREIGTVQSTVLITGESGTGKEMVAKAIHHESPRRDGPFVKVNCSAFSETLLESELFGHVRGAYTGAVADRVGRFELAQGGTLFLDEIGDVSQPIQVKLLRVLQDHEIERVGSSQTIRLDVRVIAATNRDLKRLIDEARFREDLYYRLNVIPLHLPPLRERPDDVPLLIDHLIQKLNIRLHRRVEGIATEALAVLVRYAWPGNVRQLENALEHAFVRTPGKTIALEAFPDELWRSDSGPLPSARDGRASSPSVPSMGRRSRPERDRAQLTAVLQRNEWNVTRAAQELGVNRLTVYRNMKRHGLQRP